MTDLVQPLDGLSSIAGDYDALLSDVWGVVHNGRRPHEGAVDALTRFRQGGGRVVLITNSPQLSPDITAMLTRIGVGREAYDAIISSGDVTRIRIGDYRGETVHWVGPRSYLNLIEGLDISLGTPQEAKAVVVADPDSYGDTIDMYEDRLAEWHALGLPLICANPDKWVEHDGELLMCGGALADAYLEMGGRVTLAGKPHPPIYEEAFALVGQRRGREADPAKILAIGDSARTDAAGAGAMELDFLFVTSSIHFDELHSAGDPEPADVTKLLIPAGANCIGYQSQLTW